MNYKPIQDEIFHVHSLRCKHASDEKDIEYVRKAVKLGAKRIVFTDHAPFPGNPFINRMDIEQLPEYIETIQTLKQEFADTIEIICGLEIEWLPSFKEYYQELREKKGIELLILGQHFYEYSTGGYSVFNQDKSMEFWGQSIAIKDGIKTGLFNVVAHPDRPFRRCTEFGDTERQLAKEIIDAAYENGIWNGTYFEWNYSSSLNHNYLRPEFWKMIPNRAHILYGLDAHSTDEMMDGWNFYQKEKDSKRNFKLLFLN